MATFGHVGVPQGWLTYASAVSTPPVAPSPMWIRFHAEAYGRAIELAHSRYTAVMAGTPNAHKQLDSYVEILSWATAMRQMCRVAAAARLLSQPALDAAVGAFEQVVKCREVADFRDRLEHADEYAAGRGRNRRTWLDTDFEGWTLAAQKLRRDISQALNRGPA